MLGYRTTTTARILPRISAMQCSTPALVAPLSPGSKLTWTTSFGMDGLRMSHCSAAGKPQNARSRVGRLIWMNVMSTTDDPIMAMHYKDNPGGASQTLAKDVSATPTEFSDQAKEKMAAAEGTPQRQGELIRLSETVEPHLQDGHFPRTVVTEHGRNGLGETLASGRYELVGLVDSRPGMAFSVGYVSSFRPPGGGPMSPGVWGVWRPVEGPRGWRAIRNNNAAAVS
jgi:hypothetical protein